MTASTGTGTQVKAHAQAVATFDHWVRTRFVELNTILEELYFAQPNPERVEGVGDDIKQSLVEEGRTLIRPLVDGGISMGLDEGFDLLGSVGLYMAACRRHEITEPTRETRSPLVEASTLALRLGLTLGVAPRLSTSHLESHNPAAAGIYKRFTSLPDEELFTDYNTRAVLAYQRAADALVRISPLGISHPVALDLLTAATQALEEVAGLYQELHHRLNPDRFFYNVRPYYKPYRVGVREYRGVNAGDFVGINEVDLLLGMCRLDDPFYLELLTDKYPFLPPGDQARLRECMHRRSLLDELLDSADGGTSEPWFEPNAAAFLKVCDTHAALATAHHDRLVRDFIEVPSQRLPDEHLQGITASGPPLPVLLRSLEKLRDLRRAAARKDIPTRHHDLQRLRNLLSSD